MGPPQPLLFMVHGLDQPFNTKEDRSEIARHLSKRYHRQRKLPLSQQSRKPETKVVHYPVTFHHGGQRLDVSSNRPARKRKVAVKKEDDDQALPTAVLKSSPGSTGSPDAKAANLGGQSKYEASDQSPPLVAALINPGDIKPIMVGQVPPMCYGLSPAAYHSSPYLSLVSNTSWRGDPFGSLPIRSDGCEPMTIDYYWQQWAPEADLEYQNSEYHQPHRSIVFPVAMEHPVLLQSLVAMCRVFWLQEQGLAWQNDPEYLKLRGRAVTLVQSKLESSTFAEDSTLLAIVCLNSIEMMASNPSGVISHARGLNIILRKRHGEKNESLASRYIKAQAKAHITLARFIKNRVGANGANAVRPATSITQSDQSPLQASHSLSPSYPSYPFSPQICRAISTMPQGFSELALTGLLSRECISLISSLNRKIEDWTLLCMGAEVESERKACYHLLETEGRTNTEYWLIYGIICFCNQFPDKFDNRCPFFNIALKCFRGAIEAQHKVTWSARQPWLLWVAIATTGALEICARPIESRFIILDTILDQCSDAHRWEWLEPQLRNFFWTDGLGTHWRRCWEEGLRRWQEKQWKKGLSSNHNSVPVTTPSPSAAPSVPHLSINTAGETQPVATQPPGGQASGDPSDIGKLLRDSCNLLEANRQSRVQ